MRADRAVVAAPGLDQALRLLQRVEVLAVEEFVPELRVEALIGHRQLDDVGGQQDRNVNCANFVGAPDEAFERECGSTPGGGASTLRTDSVPLISTWAIAAVAGRTRPAA